MAKFHKMLGLLAFATALLVSPRPIPALENDAPESNHRLSLLIPIYFHGDRFEIDWRTILQETHENVSVYAIVNPASGPGTEVDRHPLTGFFFDELPTERTQVVAVKRVRDYADSKLKGALIVANPGTDFDVAYHEQRVADVFVSCETESLSSAKPPTTTSWFDRVEPQVRLAALAHRVDPTSWQELFESNALADFEMVYLADVGDDGSWQQLASFYPELIQAVAKYNSKPERFLATRKQQPERCLVRSTTHVNNNNNNTGLNPMRFSPVSFKSA